MAAVTIRNISPSTILDEVVPDESITTTLQELSKFPQFIPCAATPALFLFARENLIYCIHHDTLSLVRKLKQHKTDIIILTANNAGGKGSGGTAISYDIEHNAIIWNLYTGEELARMASLEPVRAASWMRDDRVVLGDRSGNLTLLQAFTGEHRVVRTVHFAINAIAPSHDDSTMAVGYDTGTILIVTVAPMFSILHSLHTTSTPSPISGLAWHGTLSGANTEMLATHTTTGDLRVWAIPKVGHDGLAHIIRTIGPGTTKIARAWFGWSRAGKLVQYCDKGALLWDVRTNKISKREVPLTGDIIGLAAFGPSAALFTISRDFHIYQYNLAAEPPMLVSEVVHISSRPYKTTNLARIALDNRYIPEPQSASTRSAAESSDSEMFIPPHQRIAQGVEQYDEEERDQLGPLSPTSSRASSTSAASNSRRLRHAPFRFETPGSDTTTFSTGATGQHIQRGRTSRASSVVPLQTRSSALRQEILRSPDAERPLNNFDLFPRVRDRLAKVQMRVPKHGHLSVNEVQHEMLRVMFDWQDNAQSLLEFEKSQHEQVGEILLSKWLQTNGNDVLTRMVGSEMTSADWMLLALSSNMGQGSQRAVSETFVRRLLDAGEVHQAVAVLLGMGEVSTAVDVYATTHHFLEAILLNCISRPQAWTSQAQLLRRWGDMLVNQEQAETAVRCFSCASMTPELPYLSSTEDSYSEAESIARSTPISPPSAATKNRLAVMNAPLKLITNFGAGSKDTHFKASQVNTAISMELGDFWRDVAEPRERSESRTATPGGAGLHRIYPTGLNANRKGGGSSNISRASSQQQLSSSSTLRTPSTARTAQPSDVHITVKGDRRREIVLDSRATPDAKDITVSSEDDGRSKTAEVPDASELQNWNFLDDASRRARTMMAMQAVSEQNYPPQPLAPTKILPSVSASSTHRRHASDRLPFTKSLKSSPEEHDRPGSAGNSVASQPVAASAERMLREQNSAADALEERRQSLMTRPPIPAIKHPRDLMPPSASSNGEPLPSSVYVRGRGIERSVTADPSMMLRHQESTDVPHQAKRPDNGQATTPHADHRDKGPPPPFLLPATTYERPAITRAASAPPEELSLSSRTRRKASSQFETISERSLTSAGTRTLLPQLQHLTAPPPPPPASSARSKSPTTDDESSGFIHIGTDDPSLVSPLQQARSPQSRRPSFNRNSTASSPAPPSATRTTLGSKWLGRIRSSSRTQSQEHSLPSSSRMPYETVLDIPGESWSDRGGGGPSEALQRTISPASGTQGYKNPKEIRNRLKEREKAI